MVRIDRRARPHRSLLGCITNRTTASLSQTGSRPKERFSVASSNAIRGARVGSGPMGEKDHGVRAERTTVSYWDALGNETVRHFAADVDPAEIPEQIDSPHTGLPAGRDQKNPPQLTKNEPFKTHLAYVKERRTPEEAEELLEQALQKLRERRGSAAVAS